MKGILLLMIMIISFTGYSNENPSNYHTHYNFFNYKYNINTNKKIEQEVHYNYIVRNEKGMSNLNISIYQDEGNKLESIEVEYKKKGKVDKTYKLKDFSKIVIDNNLATTSFYSVLAYETQIFPIEVTVKYKKTHSNYLNVPAAYYINSENEYCASSTVEILVPKENELTYKSLHLNPKVEISELPKNKLYKFISKDIKIKDYEENQPIEIPILFFNLPEFTYYNMTGTKNSFQDLSNFTWQLWKNENVLPGEHIEYLKNITKDAKTDEQKTRIVYKYLQDNFRYISIQLGIGGLKTISANNTYKNKYGDCKGLSNYMSSALTALNINNFPVVIQSSENPLMLSSEDFVFDYANHIILCVPNKGDTIWLECTSKRIDFGYIGYSNENKMVYPILEKGGKLISTPTSKAENSQYHINTIISIEDPNNAEIIQEIGGTGEVGLIYKTIFGGVKSQITSYFVNQMKWKLPRNYIINTDNKDRARLELLIENYYTGKSGNMYFYELYPFINWTISSTQKEERVKDLMTGFPFIENDTIVYKLPGGYKLSQIPEDVEIKGKYLSYTSKRTYDVEKHELRLITQFIKSKDVIPASEYKEFRKVLHEIFNSKSAKFSIKK